MKKLILLLFLLSGCASFKVSTLNHDQIYSVEGSDVEVKVINNQFQLNRLLRKDFKFRWNFAQYAMNQPYGWYMSNYSFNRWNRYNAFDIYWNSTQYWTNWAFNYPFGYNYWGYSHSNWYNGPWNNPGYNVVWNSSRRNSMSELDRRGIASMIESSKRNNKRVIANEDKIDLIASKIRGKINAKPVKIYNNQNNTNISNNSKPRVYVRPSNNIPRVYVRPNNVVINDSRSIVKMNNKVIKNR